MFMYFLLHLCLPHAVITARDKDDCVDKNDLNWVGWLAFGILMAVHILTDGMFRMSDILYDNDWI